jgi:hypothetical protein
MEKAGLGKFLQARQNFPADHDRQLSALDFNSQQKVRRNQYLAELTENFEKHTQWFEGVQKQLRQTQAAQTTPESTTFGPSPKTSASK